ncbi:MAG: spermidine/putrescine ABC transporter substrate-binding protein [Syntrophomonadaceae bacterium]|nr:spermidine/putrescine ABC transporter substrate-binding protein [Syntrophomonadaceae bacterium]
MKKSIVMVLILVSSLVALVGCGDPQQLKEDKKLYVYNWGDYIGEDIITDFEKKYGAEVVYDQYATNEDMYVKIKQGGTKYDIAIPSEYMIEKMIKEDMLEPIDLARISNFGKINDRFKNLASDPGNKYSVPYMWGTMGIVYNSSMIDGEIDSWAALWDEKYAKQILMIDSQRESLAVALKKSGYSMNSIDPAEVEAAKQALLEQKPLVLAYVGDNYKDMMIGGEAAMAVAWSGDAVFMSEENEDLIYVVPEEGSNVWFDSMIIPKGARNVELAHQFIDFMTRPDIGQRNVEYIGYSTPNTETLALLDPETSGDPAAYPSDEVLAKCEVFVDPGPAIELYNRVWTEVKSAK